MESIEKSGKTVEEAILLALRELNTTLNDVTTEVIDAGSKGFLGFGGRPCVVRVTKKFNPEFVAKTFLREITSCIGIKIDVETKIKDKQMFIDIKGEKAGVLIGKRGQTLDAIQYILNLVVNKGNAPYINIILDTENYRKRRKETLETLAHNLAKKAKLTRKDVVLEPMSSYERRIIHYALQNDKQIVTHSEGQEPYRNIVISPKI